eukprot:TRINITY_DN11241_c0_g1_i1.p1 TRINITY_DN11241_c0_g1~~TRINITY_DN11241_c0_g1_i1.p1  ORF type:complete len:240 (+),score=30.98 TRINITY_DN11241_c0_g1_i1:50-721(+)
MEDLEIFGYIASMCFILQYVPQAVLNYQRKNVEGFNRYSIVIKLIGAAFLCVDTILLQESNSVIFYGVFNVLQNVVFMVQFSIYPGTGTGPQRIYLLWILFPIVPYILGITLPATIITTSSLKPFSQIISHGSQLKESIELRSTKGLSLPTQHLNIVGGISGLIMCYYIPPISFWTYVIYINSVLEALTVYMLTYLYRNNEDNVRYLEKMDPDDIHFNPKIDI